MKKTLIILAVANAACCGVGISHGFYLAAAMSAFATFVCLDMVSRMRG